MGHPVVLEAAVIGIPDARWDERPLACVVTAQETDPAELKASLATSFAKWQIPDSWTFLHEIEKTSVGKFDKRMLRQLHEKGDLRIVEG